MFWWKLELIFFNELEESLIWKLEELGIKNFAIEYLPKSCSDKTLKVWLSSNEWNSKERLDIELSLKALTKPFEKTSLILKWQKILNEDWSSSWKKLWQPEPLGESLLILPAWLDVPKLHEDRIVLRLDPGSAFGTGSHPTTQLCLEALEKIPPIGKKVIDVGCGSGILGIAALLFGAKAVQAFDIDPLAVRATIENSKLNHLNKSQLFVSLGSINLLVDQKQIKKADLLVCNTLFPVIEKLAPCFHIVTSLEGELLLSGLLADQVGAITDLLAKFSWHLIDSNFIDNWALIRLSRSGCSYQ